jgi:hypothetical protein
MNTVTFPHYSRSCADQYSTHRENFIMLPESWRHLDEKSAKGIRFRIYLHHKYLLCKFSKTRIMGIIFILQYFPKQLKMSVEKKCTI